MQIIKTKPVAERLERLRSDHSVLGGAGSGLSDCKKSCWWYADGPGSFYSLLGGGARGPNRRAAAASTAATSSGRRPALNASAGRGV